MRILSIVRVSPHAEMIAADWPGIGRTLFVIPTIPDAAPAAVREGIARRRMVYLSDQHTCPCGAKLVPPNRKQRRSGRTVVAAVQHMPECPASDEALDAAMGGAR